MEGWIKRSLAVFKRKGGGEESTVLIALGTRVENGVGRSSRVGLWVSLMGIDNGS